MLGIIVRTQFEGIHCYPDAPQAVKYLRNPHRHTFHVEAEIETFHEDRELEFILVKHTIDNYFADTSNIGKDSCETIATRLQNFLKRYYPVPKEAIAIEMQKIGHTPTRHINIKVFEDNENGAFIKQF